MQVKDLVFFTQHNDFIKCSLHVASSSVGEFKVFEPYPERSSTTGEVIRTSLFDNDGVTCGSDSLDIRDYPDMELLDAALLVFHKDDGKY